MPRQPRINLEGGFYHLIHRGNYRQDIFLADRDPPSPSAGLRRADREAFLERLGTCARLLRVRVHAYCLMTNHLHLLVETRLPNLSAFGQRLFASYTLWFNRKHRRVGHLFQGRFTSILVEKDRYLAELSRYIHLNPVRARMVKRPEEYDWSSLKGYARPKGGERWLYTREILGRLEGDRRAYLAYVYEGIGKAWAPTVTDRAFLGAEGFVERVKKRLGWVDGTEAREAVAEGSDRDIRRILGAVGKAFGVGGDAWGRKHARRGDTAEARRAAMAVLRSATPLTYRRIGELLGGVCAPAVAMSVAAAESDPALRGRVAAIRRNIINIKSDP